ncbi:MAG: DUF2490 domain-containing protein [Bacteroidota bacterium]
MKFLNAIILFFQRDAFGKCKYLKNPKFNNFACLTARQALCTLHSAIHFIICLFFLLLVLFPASSSSQVNDASLWLSLNAEKKITQALSATLSQEFRMNENIGELGTFFTDAGIAYKINTILKVSANYRFTNKRRLDDSYSKRHRYYIDIAIRKKFKPFAPSFRTRFQSQYTDVNCSPDGKIPDYYSRNKLTLKFDFDKKYAPYLYTELYSPFFSGKGFYIDNARYCAGIEYQLNRMHGFDFFYMIQQEYNVNNPETDYVIGIGYFLTL